MLRYTFLRLRLSIPSLQLNERRKKEDKSHLTQAAAKADGKGLLEPFVPKRMEYQYGSGVVPVTGDEDVCAFSEFE